MLFCCRDRPHFVYAFIQMMDNWAASTIWQYLCCYNKAKWYLPSPDCFFLWPPRILSCFTDCPLPPWSRPLSSQGTRLPRGQTLLYPPHTGTTHRQACTPAQARGKTHFREWMVLVTQAHIPSEIIDEWGCLLSLGNLFVCHLNNMRTGWKLYTFLLAAILTPLDLNSMVFQSHVSSHTLTSGSPRSLPVKQSVEFSYSLVSLTLILPGCLVLPLSVQISTR